jgi:hypothetical protein
MRDVKRNRLAELRTEYAAGMNKLEEMDKKKIELEATMQRDCRRDSDS